MEANSPGESPQPPSRWNQEASGGLVSTHSLLSFDRNSSIVRGPRTKKPTAARTFLSVTTIRKDLPYKRTPQRLRSESENKITTSAMVSTYSNKIWNKRQCTTILPTRPPPQLDAPSLRISANIIHISCTTVMNEASLLPRY